MNIQHVLDVELLLLAVAQEQDERLADFERLHPALQRFFDHFQVEPSDERRWSDLCRLYGYALARLDTPAAGVVYVASWVLRDAWHRLSWRYLRDAGRNGSQPDCPVFVDHAARDLLGSDRATLHALWSSDRTGDQWLRLWAEHGSRDAEIRAMAGLGEAEQELLEAARVSID